MDVTENNAYLGMKLGQYNLKKLPQWEFETVESKQMFYFPKQIYNDNDTIFCNDIYCLLKI